MSYKNTTGALMLCMCYNIEKLGITIGGSLKGLQNSSGVFLFSNVMKYLSINKPSSFCILLYFYREILHNTTGDLMLCMCYNIYYIKLKRMRNHYWLASEMVSKW